MFGIGGLHIYIPTQIKLARQTMEEGEQSKHVSNYAHGKCMLS